MERTNEPVETGRRGLSGGRREWLRDGEDRAGKKAQATREESQREGGSRDEGKNLGWTEGSGSKTLTRASREAGPGAADSRRRQPGQRSQRADRRSPSGSSQPARGGEGTVKGL